MGRQYKALSMIEQIELQKENEAQKIAISNFVRTENELRAYIERLCMARKLWGGLAMRDGLFVMAVAEILNETPAQSLQAIKAEVEEEVIELCARIIATLGVDYGDYCAHVIRCVPRKYGDSNE